MVVTPYALCRGALRLLGAVRQGETPAASDISDAYDALQEMVDQWRTDRLLIPVIEQATFPLVVGTQTYTIGVGGNFNRQRPIYLDKASLLYQGSGTQILERPLDKYDLGQWQQDIPIKATTSTIPQVFYYDNASPLGNLSVFPVPQVGASIKLYCPTALEQFTSQLQQVDLPPGYLGALRFNLAVALGPEYENGVPEHVVTRAVAYKANIEAVNVTPEMIRCDSALTSRAGTFNYYTG